MSIVRVHGSKPPSSTGNEQKQQTPSLTRALLYYELQTVALSLLLAAQLKIRKKVGTHIATDPPEKGGNWVVCGPAAFRRQPDFADMPLLDGGGIQALFKPTIDDHREPKRNVQSAENLKCVRLYLEPCRTIIRPVAAKHINVGVERAEVFDVRFDLPPKLAEVLRELALFRSSGR